jgi:predicted Zn-dependent protease
VNPDWRWRWKDVEARFDADALEKLENDFLVEFLEAALKSDADNVEVLVELGELYTQLDRVQDGLEIDQKLVKLLPENPTIRYNLACSLALTGQTQKALRELEAAMRRGFNDFRLLKQDEDLASLRGEPGFRALLDIEKKAAF